MFYKIIMFVYAALIFPTFASQVDDIAVFAFENSIGSISDNRNEAYVKSFNVTITNLSNEKVDLKGLCLKAFSPDKQSFVLHEADEILLTGSLKGNESLDGQATFVSKNSDVHNASMLKISKSC
ncbi:DUF4354 family protein [Enterobacter kobei]|uniref:DUF4354 family protein n=1 Tax=Enterobacter kobei TaxID=208224 RepID=UPI001259F282|nr:DUF4354 family protein [Enterobacter kobei]VAL18810.1 Uncharacterised protein [Enterobacter kobei]